MSCRVNDRLATRIGWINTNRLRLITLSIILCVFSINTHIAAETRSHWYSCVVKASSHTGHYTFRIVTNPCEVYWREIDTNLEIRECQLPVISALKPSAIDNYSVVWFNLETGAFYDYLSGWKDLGFCTEMKTEPAPLRERS